VEQLFELGAPAALQAELVGSGGEQVGTPNGPGARVALGQLGDRWVAHRIAAGAIGAADGLLSDRAGGATRVAVDPLAPVSEIEHNVLLAGCAPLLGALSGRVASRSSSGAVRWLMAGSGRALDMLAREQVHIAGSHLIDEQGGEDNLRAVRERLAGRRVLVVGLVRWRQGLLVAAGNPLGIAEPADLLRPGLRVASREPGAGASKLLGRLIAQAGGTVEALGAGPRCADHFAVGRAVVMGAADAGVAIESVALALGLGFVPLAVERFDLVLPAALCDWPPVARLLDALRDPALRREANALGYDTAPLGQGTTLAPASQEPGGARVEAAR